MNPIAETRIPIMLDVGRMMVFNANTMCAYEEATGKFFLDTVASLYEAMKPALDKKSQDSSKGGDAVLNVNPMDILRRVPMKDIRALVWASVHEYDRDDTPYWPLTLTQVGRILRIEDIPRIFTGFLKGHASNSPTRDEMGESQVRPMKVNGTGTHPKNDTADGGERSIELPEDVFT